MQRLASPSRDLPAHDQHCRRYVHYHCFLKRANEYVSVCTVDLFLTMRLSVSVCAEIYFNGTSIGAGFSITGGAMIVSFAVLLCCVVSPEIRSNSHCTGTWISLDDVRYFAVPPQVATLSRWFRFDANIVVKTNQQKNRNICCRIRESVIPGDRRRRKCAARASHQSEHVPSAFTCHMVLVAFIVVAHAVVCCLLRWCCKQASRRSSSRPLCASISCAACRFTSAKVAIRRRVVDDG